ncbi:hypothetical protein VTJ04DRAFT_623 [Mycothermus thermophilus]|uniref:uncharacterized protein n=1 Tax=Humicola insolens TaxID=85995 RepID=UPI003743C723
MSLSSVSPDLSPFLSVTIHAAITTLHPQQQHVHIVRSPELSPPTPSRHPAGERAGPSPVQPGKPTSQRQPIFQARISLNHPSPPVASPPPFAASLASSLRSLAHCLSFCPLFAAQYPIDCIIALAACRSAKLPLRGLVACCLMLVHLASPRSRPEFSWISPRLRKLAGPDFFRC